MNHQEPHENKSYLVISALGSDRPGLAAQITQYLHDRGGNIEESRMALFGCEAGFMILVSSAQAGIHLIKKDLRELESATSLTIQCKSTENPHGVKSTRQVIPCHITASALDHQGIVLSLSTALYKKEINMISLSTSTYFAPHSGSPLFRLEISAEVPITITPIELRETLDKIARQEGLDLEIRFPTTK